ncbi:MAG: methyltransferase domain-containing protein [Planctomycetota bacterium]
MTRNSNHDPKSTWQIPEGVEKGNWDYINSVSIAEDYDQFLAGNPIHQVDNFVLDRYLRPTKESQTVIDFGAGTGRTLAPLVERGYYGIAVDLSFSMLRTTATHFASKPTVSEPALLKANLVDLEGISDNIANHGVCMFSTLGMIQGQESRLKFLRHARRIIHQSGYLILHVHNVWFRLRHPSGIFHLTSSLIRSLLTDSEFGDERSNYRGLRDIFIHSFRANELRALLQLAGFEIQDWFGIKERTEQPIRNPGLRKILDTVGWIVVCQ